MARPFAASRRGDARPGLGLIKVLPTLERRRLADAYGKPILRLVRRSTPDGLSRLSSRLKTGRWSIPKKNAAGMAPGILYGARALIQQVIVLMGSEILVAAGLNAMSGFVRAARA